MTAALDTLAAAAVTYAARGLKVLPLHDVVSGCCSCRRAPCPHPGKHPRTVSGLDDATSDVSAIAAWWSRWPTANIGVACRSSGLVVVDIDGPEAADELRRLQRLHGSLGAPAWQRSGRIEEGWHLVYRAPDDLVVSVGRLGPGLDVKHRGYIVAAPSLHASGQRYRWVTAEPPGLPPSWLRRLLDPPPPPCPPVPAQRTTAEGAGKVLELRCADLAAVPAHGNARYRGRHDALIRAATYLGRMVAAGHLDRDEVSARLYAAAAACGLVADEGERLVRRTIADGLAYAGASA